MAEAIVIGAVLRVDLRGWSDPPPHLPKPPIKVEEGAQGTLTFYYDMCPPDHDLTATDLANRIYSQLERVMVAEKSPFNGGSFARRFTVEIGLMYDAADQRFAASWPPDFLRVMGDADAELVVTHYAFTQGGEPASEDDL